MRWGLGPVFVYDWLTSARRWQGYATRSFVVAVLLASLGWMWMAELRGRQNVTIQQLAAVGEMFFYALASTQIVLVLMTAPAATAGAICQDKQRGILSYLLVTDLSDAEIVLGKLASRTIPALAFVACGVPVMALAMLIGGIDPLALLGTTLISIGLALLGSALAFTFSVWASRTHEVLLGTYLVWGLWLLVVPGASFLGRLWFGAVGMGLLDTLAPIDPFRLAWAPYQRPGSVGLGHYLSFLGVCVLLSTILAILSTVKTRPVYLRQAGRRPAAPRAPRLSGRVRRRIRWWPGPSLDANPVLWREWHRRRGGGLGRLVTLVYATVAGLFTACAIWRAVVDQATGEVAPWVNGLQVASGLLITALAASTSLSEERARGSLDVLLATPLPTRTIVLGKWWGAFRSVPWLLVLPMALAIALAVAHPNRFRAGPFLLLGFIVAYGAALASFGLATATWVKSQGRAVALAVTAHVIVSVGWFAAVFALGQARGVACASPFFGPGMVTALLDDPTPVASEAPEITAWVLIWIGLYGIVAFSLLGVTLASFDRCLGRMPDEPWLPARGRPPVRPGGIGGRTGSRGQLAVRR